MSVLNKLSSALGRRDENPNKELAKQIVRKGDDASVAELITNLSNKNKKIQSDCIKTLYEIGELQPELLQNYIPAFVSLLKHKDNRMVWGGMSALARIVHLNRKGIYKYLSEIMEACDKGTVITKDNTVRILASLATEKKHSEETQALLLDQVRNAAVNQLAMYAELTFPVLTEENKNEFISILTIRLKDIVQPAKQKRIIRLIKKTS